MKKDLFVEYRYAQAHYNLRNFLRDKFYSNDYKVIEQFEFTDNSIYVCDYQELFDELAEAPECHLEKLVKVVNGQLLILHDFNIDCNFLANWIKKINEKFNFSTSNIWLQIPFKKEGELLNNVLQGYGLQPINILIHNEYLHQTACNLTLYEEQKKSEPITPYYKFSAFARKYKDWRYLFFCHLVERKLIQNFVYTFSDIDPEMHQFPYITISKNILIQLAQSLGFKKLGNIQMFVNSLPKLIDMSDVTNPFPKQIFDLYETSYINVILETEISNVYSGITITEKTYKAIAAQKPFLIYGPPNALKVLQNEGFKTFHPFINEEYDKIIDQNERLLFLVKELERINSLTCHEFTELIKNLNKIANHNKKIFDLLAIKNKNNTLLKTLQI